MNQMLIMQYYPPSC